MAKSGFDVIVIGGGHAGCEAATAAARIGAKTALLTHSAATIGEMSCNPAIGGIGKGTLVREVDALGGLMGVAADRAGIQFRMLNRRKGPAVWGPRTQADRTLYKGAIQALVYDQENLEVMENGVDDLLFDDAGAIRAVVTGAGDVLRCGAVVVTAGTFLRGVIHVGGDRKEAGRHGERPSNSLAERIRRLGLRSGRLKTGTPARLWRESIKYEGLVVQQADPDPVPFSFLSDEIKVPQIDCHITGTCEATHDIVRANLGKSPTFSGAIAGNGPRYCPSIEDKVVRFADRSRHQVFLEPEGLDAPLVYPNGISTALPLSVQKQLVRSIPGLETAEIARAGYAIEYDHIDPRDLTHGLECKSYPSLFMAGQINGTTGYEEAAAQGIIAGTNAALRTGLRDPLILDRGTALIGVMIDDLVSMGISEPYRMFTSRAEYRLRLRPDNADIRLSGFGVDVGLVKGTRRDRLVSKQHGLEVGRRRLRGLRTTPRMAQAHGISISPDGGEVSAADLLGRRGGGFAPIAQIWPELQDMDSDVAAQLEIEARYAPYLHRQDKEIAVYRKEAGLRLSEDLDYRVVRGLSNEAREKLGEARPESLAAASRVAGVTPAAMGALLRHVRRGSDETLVS